MADQTSTASTETTSESGPDPTAQTGSKPTSSSETTPPAPKKDPPTWDMVRDLRREAAENRIKLREYEDRDKTDLQKAAERATKAEADAAKASERLMRFEVASDKGLTAAQARRLIGNTREELEQDAEQLKRELGATGRTGGQTDFGSGVRNGGSPDPADMNSLIRSAAGRP